MQSSACFLLAVGASFWWGSQNRQLLEISDDSSAAFGGKCKNVGRGVCSLDFFQSSLQGTAIRATPNPVRGM